jgi:hypothetical protein
LGYFGHQTMCSPSEFTSPGPRRNRYSVMKQRYEPGVTFAAPRPNPIPLTAKAASPLGDF